MKNPTLDPRFDPRVPITIPPADREQLARAIAETAVRTLAQEAEERRQRMSTDQKIRIISIVLSMVAVALSTLSLVFALSLKK